MIDAPLALAFTAGMVATVNPCGFALLPAYLSYFVGIDRDEGRGVAERSTGGDVARGLLVGTVVTGGFVLVFGSVGAGLQVGMSSAFVRDWVPWLALAVGTGLVGLGVAMLAGHHVRVRLPRLDRGGRSRGIGSVFVFGVSYAIASLSCTLPVFLAVVAGTLTRVSFTSGLATFLAYALGMGVVLLVVTLALALAKHGVVSRLRSAMRHVDRAAGALLVAAGGYVVYYWVWVLSTGATSGAPRPIRIVEGLSADATRWIGARGVGFGLLLGAVVLGALAAVLVWRGSSAPQGHGDDADRELAPPVRSG